MKHPSHWNKEDLHCHIQYGINMELWTVPLYLTALYSIKDLKKLKHHEYPGAAKLIFSVVIQEMLHLELICNISNALGYSPKFVPPVYDEQKGIPFIHPPENHLPKLLKGYSVKPHALNADSLRLFCAIELPHEKKDIVWENENTFSCIGDLYESLKCGITALWNECYVGDEQNTKQKNTFKEYYNRDGKNHGFSQVINSAETALKAIEAIIDQGEGANSKNVPVDFRPPETEEGKEYDIAWYKGNLSHYHKFRILLHSPHKLPPVYLENSGESSLIKQAEMEKVFSDLLKEMETSFNKPGEEMEKSFWNKMTEFGNALIALWESGACPHFNMNFSD